MARSLRRRAVRTETCHLPESGTRSRLLPALAFVGTLGVLQIVACGEAHEPADLPEAVNHPARIEAEVSPTFTIRGEAKNLPSLADRMEELGVPGVSLAVLNDGRVEWARGYGFADVATGRRVTPETLFQAASISKPVAALAALTLVEQGVLDLDENVNSYLDRWTLPDNDFTGAEKVTLRRLLNHTAGTTVWGFPGYAASPDVPSTVDVLEGHGNTDPIRVFKTPGESWRYSGGGYTIMQLVLAETSQTSFPEFMSDTMLEPAGMTRSTYAQPLPEARWQEAATGYRADDTPVEENWHIYPEMAAAGLWTTPTDLAHYAMTVQAAVTGDPEALLSEDLAAEMLTAGLNGHGLGPVLEEDATRFSHGGSNAGFRTSFTAFVRDGRGAFVMTNSDAGGVLAQEIILTIAREYGWPGLKPVEKVPVVLGQDVLEEIAGTYQVPGEANQQASIAFSDGKLMASLGGQEADELVAESETTFFFRRTGSTLRVEFENDRPNALVLGSIRAERID